MLARKLAFLTETFEKMLLVTGCCVSALHGMCRHHHFDLTVQSPVRAHRMNVPEQHAGHSQVMCLSETLPLVIVLAKPAPHAAPQVQHHSRGGRL
jgi:hypothetical protein